jgi:S-adenosylmethionine synthetase
MGHPDKLCDLIADSILDACLWEDADSRVACEVMATKGRIIVAGEITCSEYVDLKSVTRSALRRAGYDPKCYKISLYIQTQSPDIAA